MRERERECVCVFNLMIRLRNVAYIYTSFEQYVHVSSSYIKRGRSHKHARHWPRHHGEYKFNQSKYLYSSMKCESFYVIFLQVNDNFQLESLSSNVENTNIQHEREQS